MTMNNHPYAQDQFLNFIKSKSSGFVYLRGRRRIGKTTLLKKLQSSKPKQMFYFSGSLDERDSRTLERFVIEWSQFSNSSTLHEIKVELLTWSKCFNAILQYANNNKKQGPLIVAFDEIQWLAKGQNGFIGLLKESWVAWEQSGLIKVIICGSSNKFFHTQTGGEETILRGLRTNADIWLYDIPPHILKLNYAPAWNWDQIVFTYFLFGGVPYYWNQLKETKNFYQSINQAVFNSSTIFLEEINEILRLEFNSAGVETVKKIIRAIGLNGATEQSIQKKSRLSQSTLNEALHKLIDYGIIFEAQNPFSEKGSKNKGVSYYLKDFLLNNYSQILYPNRNNILKNNTDQLIFLNLLEGNKNLYITNYTGRAFERFIQILIENPKIKSNIHTLIGINNMSYDVCNFKSNNQEIDLIIYNTTDEVYRLVECKWTKNITVLNEEIKKITLKVDELRKTYKIKEPIECFIISNCPASKKQVNSKNGYSVKKKGHSDSEIVRIITLEEILDVPI